MTAWPDRPEVDEELGPSCGLAGVPALGCAPSVLAEGRGRPAVLRGPGDGAAEPEPAPGCG